MRNGPNYHMPLAKAAIVLALVIVAFLFALIQVGAITLAFQKLGLDTNTAFLLLLAILFGGGINIPLFSTGRRVRVCKPDLQAMLKRHSGPWVRCEEGETKEQWVAVNFGGCLIPCFLSAFLLMRVGVSLPLLLCVAAVTAVCYVLTRPVQGVGLGVPLLVPPLVAALSALALAGPEQAPAYAYIAGVTGTLLGADVLHILNPKTMEQLEAPLLSIGGAGTFDGIFITGIFAVLIS